MTATARVGKPRALAGTLAVASLALAACSGNGAGGGGDVSGLPRPGDKAPAGKIDRVACDKVLAIVAPVIAALPASAAPLPSPAVATLRTAATDLQGVTSTNEALRARIGGLAIGLAQVDSQVAMGKANGGPALGPLRKDLAGLGKDCKR